jgi:hypothetical protein
MCIIRSLRGHLVFSITLLLLMIITANIEAYSDSATGRKNRSSAEMNLLRETGLSEDVNDSQIIALLDSQNNRSSAALLIRYRKITSASPKLLEIVNNANIRDVDRLMASEALCDFGNKEWLPTIKAMITDPNVKLSHRAFKYNAAGLLARAGDFSQFDVVVKGLSNEEDYIRSTAIRELGKFEHPTDPVTDSAAALLSSIAKSDKTPRFRAYAIESLENLAKAKPELKQKIIEALEANVDCADKNVRRICEVKLMMYKKQSEPNKPSK